MARTIHTHTLTHTVHTMHWLEKVSASVSIAKMSCFVASAVPMHEHSYYSDRFMRNSMCLWKLSKQALVVVFSFARADARVRSLIILCGGLINPDIVSKTNNPHKMLTISTSKWVAVHNNFVLHETKKAEAEPKNNSSNSNNKHAEENDATAKRMFVCTLLMLTILLHYTLYICKMMLHDYFALSPHLSLSLYVCVSPIKIKRNNLGKPCRLKLKQLDLHVAI